MDVNRIFNLNKTKANEDEENHDAGQHLHPDSANLQSRRSSFRPPLTRSPSQHGHGMLAAVSNAVEFVRDERGYRGHRGYTHSRYPKGTSSASTSPDLDSYSKDRKRNDHSSQEYNTRVFSRRSRRYRKEPPSTSSSPCYSYDPIQNRRNQLSQESYEYDTHVLNGRSRSPSPSQRQGTRHENGVSSLRHCNGRKLPPTPKQPSTLQIPIQSSNMNFPKLDTSPSSLHGAQPNPNLLPNSIGAKTLLFDANKHLKYDDIERELYERERDVDSECDFKSPQDQRLGQGPLSFEEALLLSRPVHSSSVVWDGFKTTVVGYSAQNSVFDEEDWC